MSRDRVRRVVVAGRLIWSYFLFSRGASGRVAWVVRRGWAAFRFGGIGEVWHRAARLVSFLAGATKPPQYTLEEESHPLTFLPASEPLVSIVVPVYNQWRYTFTSLKSVRENTPDIPYELLVVDDASDDETPAMLALMRGIRVIHHAENRGFLAACMSGAEAARGRYLVFLNNDTIVRRNWLLALLETFRLHPDAGLVGAKLLTPVGRLQEAGAIVYRDGSGWQYGRTDDPSLPQYNYVREVDYCSGACVMIPRDLFFSCGGFDRRFCPAYYEDTDLAFTVRRAGKRVLYQPNAEVIHFEGATSGPDLSSGPKRYQTRNRDIFRKKWEGVLQGHQPSGTDPDRERDRYARSRILVIDFRVSTPDRDSGSLRMANLLKLLHESKYKVTFIPDDLAAPSLYRERLQAQGIEVLCFPYLRKIRSFLRSRGAQYDIIVLCRVTVATKYIDILRRSAPEAFTIFDTVDLHFLREQRRARLLEDRRALLQARALQREECRIARLADLTFVVGQAERDVLIREAPEARVEVLSNIHAVHGSAQPFSARRDIIFIGGFDHPPNVDAVLYFVQSIWPHVRTALPEAALYIIGDDPPPQVRTLADDPRIIVTGYVPDAEEYFHRCRISVAPLRYGAGVKGKINQSMSHGVPVVATPVAAESMYLVDGENALIAETPDDFARKVTRLYTDETLWSLLSVNGLENVRRYFSFEAARVTVEEVLGRISSERARSSRNGHSVAWGTRSSGN